MLFGSEWLGSAATASYSLIAAREDLPHGELPIKEEFLTSTRDTQTLKGDSSSSAFAAHYLLRRTWDDEIARRCSNDYRGRGLRLMK